MSSVPQAPSPTRTSPAPSRSSRLFSDPRVGARGRPACTSGPVRHAPLTPRRHQRAHALDRVRRVVAVGVGADLARPGLGHGRAADDHLDPAGEPARAHQLHDLLHHRHGGGEQRRQADDRRAVLLRPRPRSAAAGTSLPRSITSNPAPLSMMPTRFLPMSCRSPCTEPITTRPGRGHALLREQRLEQVEARRTWPAPPAARRAGRSRACGTARRRRPCRRSARG